jgi:hypothetical protein
MRPNARSEQWRQSGRRERAKRIVASALALVSFVPIVAASPRRVADVPPASRGETALRSSFYLNTVSTLVEIVVEINKELLPTLDIEPERSRAVEQVVRETWTEKRLYENAAAQLEKQIAPDVLDAATAQLTPRVQAMIVHGTAEVRKEDLQPRLLAIRQHPDAKEREALARRIALHMPQPERFEELLTETIEVLADTVQVATGTDEMRGSLRASTLAELKPLLEAMKQKEGMVLAGQIAYYDRPTDDLRALADALDSPAGRQLQEAALASLVSGVKATRRELTTRLRERLSAAEAR